MVKTSSRKLSTVRGNVLKRVIRTGQDDEEHKEARHSFIISKLLEKVGPLAKSQWKFLVRTCTKWNLILVEYDSESGRARPSAFWKRCIHYILLCLYAIIMVYRLHVTIQRVTAGNLDIFTYMGGCTCLISMVFSVGVYGLTYLSLPLCDVLNSWKSLELIFKLEFRRPMTIFDGKSTCLEVLLMATIVHLAGINASMFSIVGEVPTSVLPTLKSMGWFKLPDVIPSILWSIVFFPLELITLWPPMLVTGILAITFILALGAFKLIAKQARYVVFLGYVFTFALRSFNEIMAVVGRNKKSNNMNDWMRIYRLYRIMQVYNSILTEWMQNTVVMGLVGMASSVIVLLYVTIRPSTLPWFIYIWFPIVAAIAMVIIAWISFDCVIIKREVADVAQNLQLSLDSWRFRDIEKRRRTVYNRMLQSLHPASLRLGPFGEISLDTPINTWDEVLNQLLFLLSF